MTERRVLLVVGPAGVIEGPLDSARSVVIADVHGLDIARWQMQRVAWDEHSEDGDPNRRVIDFIASAHVEAVVVGEVGPRLRELLASAGVAVFQRAGISARAAAISAATVLALVQHTL